RQTSNAIGTHTTNVVVYGVRSDLPTRSGQNHATVVRQGRQRCAQAESSITSPE
ncbi:hypothetical protein SARC_17388, partial [Sphaeroforma arctica JP610]